MSAKERVTAKERARSRTDGHHEAHLALTGKHTLLVLAAIVLLAFFLRSFFAYGPSISNGFALSGGSDAVYYQRVIDHIVSTGQQLVNDPLLNYPYDSANPREPLYAWVVAVGGMFLTLFGIPTETAVGMSFVFSTAIFGALACIPVYLIARETFGNRTGLIAAALMAISAAAISPSVLSNGDHDAMAMFFILWTFYFFLRAFTKVKGSRWVEDWRSLRSIKEGLKAFVRENRVGILYAFLAGISLALVSLTWKGFVYAMAILVIFLLVQLLIDRFSNRDSMPVAILFAVTGISWALLSLPYYLGMGFINTWWDLPAYLVLGGLIISVYFTVTRDKPWTLAIPGFVLVVIAGLAFLALFLPHVLEGLISGQGYFVQSKLYSTIAEAQAPSFSSLAMSYGVATIWLAIVGAIYAVIQIPRVKKPAYVFIVVWLVVAMFMASSAQRFVFNGAVAFAIAAAVAIDLLLRKVDLRSYYKDIGSADWRRKWREVLKPVPLLTVLFMTFLVLAPNVWVAVDASMPNNTKADYDKQIYDAMPSFLQPDDYEYGNLYYLGSRGYSIYTEKNWYFFDAFDWLSQQDSDIYPESERPAFLSWWDYGFEAITYGAHPTVADNFQNGYNMAANFITAQSEEEAIALFIVRILETERFSNETRSVLADHGINPDALEDRIFNSGNYINTILANPSVYGSYSDDLSAANARYIESSHYLTSRLDGEGLASLYHNLRDTTGNDIAYFAVDTRLFPWSVNSMGIFSAPAKLSDHVIDEFGVPSDFYEIYAYLSDGSYVPISELKQGMTVQNYVLLYKEPLYESMMWRAFMGFNPIDLGLNEQGIPGLAGSLAEYESMPGWGLEHFRMVYRTAMYNPYDDYQSHSDAWEFISYDEALELQEAIANGEASGVVDLSSSNMLNGVVFIQYYDGAEISGTVTNEYGDPVSGVYVTVYDEYGIPHMIRETDSNGQYKVLAPFGNVTVTFSTGEYDSLMMRGEELLQTNEYYISYSEAMRSNTISASSVYSDDVVINGSKLTGTLTLDGEPMSGAVVRFLSDTQDLSVETAADGSYEINGLLPGEGRVIMKLNGHELLNQTVSVSLSDSKTVNLDAESSSLTVTLLDADGKPLHNTEVILFDETNGSSISEYSDTTGKVVFTSLFKGRYTLSLADEAFCFAKPRFDLGAGEDKRMTMEVESAMLIDGRAELSDGTPLPYASVTLTSLENSYTALSDANGRFVIVVPDDNYSLYVHGALDGKEYSYLKSINASSPLTPIVLTESAILSGKVKDSSGVANAELLFMADDGATYRITANAAGSYRAALPAGSYLLLASGEGKAWWGTVNIAGSVPKDISLGSGTSVSGCVYGPTSQGLQASLSVKATAGRTLTILSDADGNYSFTVPAGNLIIEVEAQGFEMAVIEGTFSGSVQKDISLVPKNISVSGNVDAAVSIEFTAVEGSGGASITVDADGNYSVELRPGEYEVRVWQNVDGNDTLYYRHSSTLNVEIGSEPLTHDIPLTLMVKTKISGLESGDTLRISGYDSTLKGSTSYTVYLEAGEHSFYALRGNTGAFFDVKNVSIDNNVVVTMSRAFLLEVQLVHNGSVYEADTSVTVSAGGASMDFEASSGLLSVYLPDGNYSLSASFTDLVDNHYYLFSGHSELTVSSDTYADLTLSRQLRNVTLSYEILRNGVPSTASVDLYGVGSAISLSLEGSSGSVSIAPGNYTVYARNGDYVYLSTLSVEAFEDAELSIVLSKGKNLIGQFTASGIGIFCDATIGDGAIVPLSVDSNGRFNIWLPQGYYSIEAETATVENGVSVAYHGAFSVSLNDNSSLTLPLTRDDQRSVTLSSSVGTQSADPGDSFTISLLLRNSGNVDETVTLSSNGWAMSFSDNGFVLPCGSLKTVTVTVTVPNDALVEHDDVKVNARGADGKLLGSLTLDVDVNPMPSISLSYSGSGDASTSHYDYNVTLSNDGNIGDRFTLTVINAEELQNKGWAVSLLDASGEAVSSKELDAGEETTITVRLTPIEGITQSEAVITLKASSPSLSYDLTFTAEFPDLHIADSITIEGGNIYSSPGGVSIWTWTLLGLSIIAITLFLLMASTRGVFKRKKQ